MSSMEGPIVDRTRTSAVVVFVSSYGDNQRSRSRTKRRHCWVERHCRSKENRQNKKKPKIVVESPLFLSLSLSPMRSELDRASVRLPNPDHYVDGAGCRRHFRFPFSAIRSRRWNDWNLFFPMSFDGTMSNVVEQTGIWCVDVKALVLFQYAKRNSILRWFRLQCFFPYSTYFCLTIKRVIEKM